MQKIIATFFMFSLLVTSASASCFWLNKKEKKQFKKIRSQVEKENVRYCEKCNDYSKFFKINKDETYTFHKLYIGKRAFWDVRDINNIPVDLDNIYLRENGDTFTQVAKLIGCEKSKLPKSININEVKISMAADKEQVRLKEEHVKKSFAYIVARSYMYPTEQIENARDECLEEVKENMQEMIADALEIKDITLQSEKIEKQEFPYIQDSYESQNINHYMDVTKGDSSATILMPYQHNFFVDIDKDSNSSVEKFKREYDELGNIVSMAREVTTTVTTTTTKVRVYIKSQNYKYSIPWAYNVEDKGPTVLAVINLARDYVLTEKEAKHLKDFGRLEPTGEEKQEQVELVLLKRLSCRREFVDTKTTTTEIEK